MPGAAPTKRLVLEPVAIVVPCCWIQRCYTAESATAIRMLLVVGFYVYILRSVCVPKNKSGLLRNDEFRHDESPGFLCRECIPLKQSESSGDISRPAHVPRMAQTCVVTYGRTSCVPAEESCVPCRGVLRSLQRSPVLPGEESARKGRLWPEINKPKWQR